MLDRGTGRMDLRVPVEEDRPENRANDVKVDGRGRAWVGTMAYDKRAGNAALYRVDGGCVEPSGRRAHDLQRARLRREARAACTSPTRRSSWSTPST